jgi:hypothetical protein
MTEITKKKKQNFEVQSIIKNFKKTIKKNSYFVIIVLGLNVLMVLIIILYFHFALNREHFIIKKALENINQQSAGGDVSLVSPLIIEKLQNNGVERYFLSKVELIGNYYTPVVHLCLFKDGKPIYPQYVYETWALINYSSKQIPEVAMVRYKLLPEDNANFNLDKDCFIKEIKTTKDWQEVEEKYGFSLSKF